MRFVSALLMAIGSFALGAVAPGAEMPGHTQGENMVSTNECVAKAGVGIVNTHLYVDLKATKNELMLDGGSRWIGQGRGTPEVVLFFENRVWPVAQMPPKFDLGKAVIVSFEGDVVRFFDFARTSGGFYRRPQT